MINLLSIVGRKKYFVVAQLFLTLSLTFGTWVIYIPHIINKLQIAKSEFGVVLLFSAIGSLVALPVGRFIVTKIGEGRLALISTISYALIVFCNFLANSPTQLSVLLFFNGFIGSFFQIGMNSLVASVEREDGVSIMSACHGFFSFGGIISAGFGTDLLIWFGNPILHMGTMVVVVILLQVFFAKNYINYKSEVKTNKEEQKLSLNAFKSKSLWLLAVVALCVMVSEGAIADWSALFLRDVAHTNIDLIGLGYAAFSVTMALGRFMGDYFSSKYGAHLIILVGYILGAFGLAIVLLSIPYVSIMGFAIVGLGVSIIVPEVYRLSTHIEGVDASSGISFMAGSGFFGFLAGPVALGFIAETKGLQFSFFTIFGLIIVGAIFSIINYWKAQRG